jgi:hypothetical protein
VRLVADNQIPPAVRGLQLLLHIFVAREFVKTGNDKIVFEKPIAGSSRFKLVIGQNLEGKLETAVKLILPLLGKAAWADDKTPLQVTTGYQFLDEQAGHDGLAGTRIIGKKKPKRLPRKHGLVNGSYLVWQRLNKRGMDSQYRIEQVR